jgi:putative drug exporter of the RND superfamily
MNAQHDLRPKVAEFVSRRAVLVILAWLAVACALNIVVPQLEAVTKANSVSLAPTDSGARVAMKRIGLKFGEFDSDSAVMILLEGAHPLGDDAKRFYDGLVTRLQRDSEHVQHVQNFWGDRITAGGAQSEDGKAAYVQVNLVGNQGETRGTQSVDAVRDLVKNSPPPPGLKAYVTGPAALVSDGSLAGDKSMVRMTVITVVVIAAMLLILFRSISTSVIVLAVVLVEMAMARGVVAALGDHHLFGLSVFVVSMLTAAALATGTDYMIFLIGRYHEARTAGQSEEDAYYTAIRGVVHVIAGSGLTIAGAMLCLRFTRLNYFSSLAIPCALGMIIVLAMALTLGPAVLAVAGRRGLLEPERQAAGRGWRRLGSAIVRWPAPILFSASAIALVGILALPGYRTNYNERTYLPSTVPASVGYAAADRHFKPARLNPDILMVEASRDLRNPSDMLVLEHIAKNMLGLPGVAQVQSITRPLGSPLGHSSVPFQISAQSAATRESLQFLQARLDDTQKVIDQMGILIAIMEHLYGLLSELTDTTHSMDLKGHDVQAVTEDMRDHIADFDDFWRPIRSYLYWERHCYDIPVCSSTRSLFDATDSVDKLSDQAKVLLEQLDKADALTPQVVAQVPPMIAISKTIRDLFETMHATFSGMLDQMQRMTGTATVMGQVFDDAKNDDMFYLPPDAFDSPDFQRGLQLMVSPDGKAARMFITHSDDPATPAGIGSVDAILQSAKSAVKGTPLADAKFYLAGTAATYKDIQDASFYDLLIVAVAAVVLIFAVMLVITRALVAAMVIVGTVVLSLAASFGMSVLIWQYLLGVELAWLVLPMAVIVLLAVGSDYNLLFVARLKEEIGAGLNTGLIRAMGGTGAVVTAAGLVFAFTMISMATSDLRSIGQIGTTIGVGLLFDTFIVRSLITPSVAALLGRWFWWPQWVRPRPLRSAWPSRTAAVVAPVPDDYQR